MVNIIWSFFIILGIIYSILTNRIDIINTTILESAKTSLDMIIQIFPVLALWMGIMNIAQKSNLLNKISKILFPLLSKLFPEIPKNHESLGFIASNIIANVFGLGSAATPFGLKAMQSLQKLNKNKTKASRSMITFLVINTSGVTLIPTTIISMRMMHNSSNPNSILLACIIGTLCSTIGGVFVDKLFAKWYHH